MKYVVKYLWMFNQDIHNRIDPTKNRI